MEHLDPAWIERLGGWAAVLIVVRWMMSRMDKLIDGMKLSIDAFQKFQAQEERCHDALIQTQREILDQIKALRPEVPLDGDKYSP